MSEKREQEGRQSISAAGLVAGSRLGPYEIEGELGAGGMGRVYRARDTRLGRMVAIKLCAEEFSGRFEREARAISSLNHPHICTLYDVGPNYLVMELVDGRTLKGPLAFEQAVQYGVQIADALAAAHNQGIIHRDLKPSNIMVTRSGIKVLDFGLAKFNHPDENETLTGSHVIVGTPAYMAPEQRAGRACDARTDIHALGLVLKELQPTPCASLAHVVDRCVATNPAERWQAASDVKLELEWVAGVSRQPPPGVPRRGPGDGWRR